MGTFYEVIAGHVPKCQKNFHVFWGVGTKFFKCKEVLIELAYFRCKDVLVMSWSLLGVSQSLNDVLYTKNPMCFAFSSNINKKAIRISIAYRAQP